MDPSDAEFGLEQWPGILEKNEYQDFDTLNSIKKEVEQLWSIKSDALVSAAKTLADGSKDENWRIPFGEAGILDIFLSIIATENISDDLCLHTLRFIGNACADRDANRERIVSANTFPMIIKHIQNESLAYIAVPVLNNICTDYGDVSQCPESAIPVLLQQACSADLETDDLVSLMEAVAVLLEHERFQELFVMQDLMGKTLNLLISTYSPNHLHSNSLSVADLIPIKREIEEEEQLSRLRNLMVNALSNVSATPGFSLKYPIHSETSKVLFSWVSAPQASLQKCACLMLGNLARGDTICKEMVQTYGIHKTLIEVLRDSSDLHVLHSALAFLWNLALPLENKAIIGETEILASLLNFWAVSTSPQLQYVAVSLTRQLINGSFVNVQRILTSPVSSGESSANEDTYLSHLLLLSTKTDDLPIQVEIARVVTAALRCIMKRTSLSDEAMDEVQHRLCMHDNIAEPFASMISQSSWPVVRSEGWFALALMARSKAGAAAVDGILQKAEVYAALVRTMDGAGAAPTAAATKEIGSRAIEDMSDPGFRLTQEKEMETKDRENATILLHELKGFDYRYTI